MGRMPSLTYILSAITKIARRDENLICTYPLISLSLQALRFKLGVVTTGNSLDHVEADDAQMAANGAYLIILNIGFGCGNSLFLFSSN